MQQKLTFHIRREDITDNFIMAKCTNFRDALILCVECSEKAPKEIIAELADRTGHRIDETTFSKCLSRNSSQPRNWPPEFVEVLEDICGNIIPTRFKAIYRQFNLVPMKTKIEEENEGLRAELERERLKNQAIHEFLRDKGLKL